MRAHAHIETPLGWPRRGGARPKPRRRNPRAVGAGRHSTRTEQLPLHTGPRTRTQTTPPSSTPSTTRSTPLTRYFENDFRMTSPDGFCLRVSSSAERTTLSGAQHVLISCEVGGAICNKFEAEMSSHDVWYSSVFVRVFSFVCLCSSLQLLLTDLHD